MIVYIYPSVLQAVSGGAMQVAWSGCFQGYRVRLCTIFDVDFENSNSTHSGE